MQAVPQRICILMGERDSNQTFLQINGEFPIFLYARHIIGEAHLACAQGSLSYRQMGMFQLHLEAEEHFEHSLNNNSKMRAWCTRGIKNKRVQGAQGGVESSKMQLGRRSFFATPWPHWLSASISNLNMGSTYLVHLLCQVYCHGSLLNVGSIGNAW